MFCLRHIICEHLHDLYTLNTHSGWKGLKKFIPRDSLNSPLIYILFSMLIVLAYFTFNFNSKSLLVLFIISIYGFSQIIHSIRSRSRVSNRNSVQLALETGPRMYCLNRSLPTLGLNSSHFYSLVIVIIQKLRKIVLFNLFITSQSSICKNL